MSQAPTLRRLRGTEASTLWVSLTSFNLVPLLSILAGIVSSGLFWWNRDSLWEDELIAITHVLEPIPYFFTEIVRHDIHPFLYFLLLKVWAAFNISSDSWILASSLFFHLASAVVIGAVAARVHGRSAALWVVALYCLLPSSVAAAGNLRMYGLMPGLAALCWYANREYISGGRRTWLAGLFVLQFVQAYTHAIGFFFIPFFALAAIIEKRECASRKRLRAWLVTQTLSFITMLPVVGSALMRGAEPLPVPSASSLLTFPSSLLVGGQAVGFPHALLFGGAIFAVMLIFALKARAGRVPALVITCGALVACILISAAGKPMFKPPVFAANLVPFLALGAGAAMSTCKPKWLRFGLSGFMLMQAITTAEWASEKHIPENYKPVAQYIKSNVKAGDVVVAPNPSVYWGVLRYAVAANWGSPLSTMPMQSNEAWIKFEERLGPRAVAFLRLKPETDFIEMDGVRYVIGRDAHSADLLGERIWLVHRKRYAESVVVGQSMKVESVHWYGDELSLTVLVKAPTGSGSTSFANPTK